eukprot:TRINITY_DN5839_c0_g1_i1.p1 TRINITY_DN5839_c0_g1~~TRINITY_DN5839_c0_g1_i1.p1  ORF type:complete len:1238 (+),score=326.31 TRINITY_DN5839_c0_g1_i1:120-3833(+)
MDAEGMAALIEKQADLNAAKEHEERELARKMQEEKEKELAERLAAEQAAAEARAAAQMDLDEAAEPEEDATDEEADAIPGTMADLWAAGRAGASRCAITRVCWLKGSELLAVGNADGEISLWKAACSDAAADSCSTPVYTVQFANPPRVAVKEKDKESHIAEVRSKERADFEEPFKRVLAASVSAAMLQERSTAELLDSAAELGLAVRDDPVADWVDSGSQRRRVTDVLVNYAPAVRPEHVDLDVARGADGMARSANGLLRMRLAGLAEGSVPAAIRALAAVLRDPSSQLNEGSQTRWGVLTVIGCAADLDKGELLFGRNGSWGPPYGRVFTGADFSAGLFPALSGSFGARAHFNFCGPFRHGPPDESYAPLQQPGDDGVDCERLRGDPDGAFTAHAGEVGPGRAGTDVWLQKPGCSVGWPRLLLRGGKAFFEVSVNDPAEALAVGWATPEFKRTDAESTPGVGDCAASWAVDGVRHLRLHKPAAGGAACGGGPLSYSFGSTRQLGQCAPSQLGKPTSFIDGGHSVGYPVTALCAAGRRLYSAAADSTIKAWEATPRGIKGPLWTFGLVRGAATSLAIDAAGSTLAAAVDGAVLLINPRPPTRPPPRQPPAVLRVRVPRGNRRLRALIPSGNYILSPSPELPQGELLPVWRALHGTDAETSRAAVLSVNGVWEIAPDVPLSHGGFEPWHAAHCSGIAGAGPRVRAVEPHADDTRSNPAACIWPDEQRFTCAELDCEVHVEGAETVQYAGNLRRGSPPAANRVVLPHAELRDWPQEWRAQSPGKHLPTPGEVYCDAVAVSADGARVGAVLRHAPSAAPRYLNRLLQSCWMMEWQRDADGRWPPLASRATRLAPSSLGPLSAVPLALRYGPDGLQCVTEGAVTCGGDGKPLHRRVPLAGTPGFAASLHPNGRSAVVALANSSLRVVPWGELSAAPAAATWPLSVDGGCRCVSHSASGSWVALGGSSGELIVLRSTESVPPADRPRRGPPQFYWSSAHTREQDILSVWLHCAGESTLGAGLKHHREEDEEEQHLPIGDTEGLDAFPPIAGRAQPSPAEGEGKRSPPAASPRPVLSPEPAPTPAPEEPHQPAPPAPEEPPQPAPPAPEEPPQAAPPAPAALAPPSYMSTQASSDAGLSASGPDAPAAEPRALSREKAPIFRSGDPIVVVKNHHLKGSTGVIHAKGLQNRHGVEKYAVTITSFAPTVGAAERKQVENCKNRIYLEPSVLQPQVVEKGQEAVL